jgi:hypothetical protein
MSYAKYETIILLFLGCWTYGGVVVRNFTKCKKRMANRGKLSEFAHFFLIIETEHVTCSCEISSCQVTLNIKNIKWEP